MILSRLAVAGLPTVGEKRTCKCVFRLPIFVAEKLGFNEPIGHAKVEFLNYTLTSCQSVLICYHSRIPCKWSVTMILSRLAVAGLPTVGEKRTCKCVFRLPIFVAEKLGFNEPIGHAKVEFLNYTLTSCQSVLICYHSRIPCKWSVTMILSRLAVAGLLTVGEKRTCKCVFRLPIFVAEKLGFNEPIGHAKVEFLNYTLTSCQSVLICYHSRIPCKWSVTMILSRLAVAGLPTVGEKRTSKCVFRLPIFVAEKLGFNEPIGHAKVEFLNYTLTSCQSVLICYHSRIPCKWSVTMILSRLAVAGLPTVGKKRTPINMNQPKTNRNPL